MVTSLVLECNAAGSRLPRHVLFLLKLLLVGEHGIGLVTVERVYSMVGRHDLMRPLAACHLLHVHAARIHWLLFHHLREERVLRLALL